MNGKAPTGMNKETPRVQNMQVRDWFAGQALIAIIGLQSDAGINGECSDAYMYADQMLKARG